MDAPVHLDDRLARIEKTLWLDAYHLASADVREARNYITLLTEQRNIALAALKRISYGLQHDARTADGWTRADAVAEANSAIAKIERRTP